MKKATKRIFLKLAAAVVLIATVINLAACTVEVKAKNLMDGIERRTVTPDGDLTEGSAALTNLAVRLLKSSEEGNVLLSPLSIVSALAMAANGARGETLRQMEELFGMSAQEMNLFLYSYVSGLPNGEKYKLTLASSIWFRSEGRFTANPDFLQTNADYYGADLYATPFDRTTLKDVNNWVKGKTDGMIKKVLDEIPDSAVMYLINALAFEAEWMKIYEKHQVRDGAFTTSDGQKQDVEFMYATEGRYLADEGAEGFVKYYNGGKYAFVALLPNEDTSLADYLTGLDGERLSALLSAPQQKAVKTAIPKFSVEYSANLVEILQSLGMTDAFDVRLADLSGLGDSAEGNLFINRIIHKTYIEVGEKGTKAGAVTVIENNDGSAGPPEDPKEVYLDRPFVYMLIDCENSIPFFIGTVTDMES